MSRVTYAVPSRKRRKMVLQRAKGFYGNASRNIRTAYDAVDKALSHSYVGRKQKKQQYRQHMPQRYLPHGVRRAKPSQDLRTGSRHL